jgi:proline iminopeptidase
MKKKIIIAVGVLIALVLIAGGVVWYMMMQPLYKPGMIVSNAKLMLSLQPPAQQADSSYWEVQQHIRLHHFSDGKGTNILVLHGGPGYPFARPLPGLQPLTDNFKFHYYDQRGCGKSTRPIEKFATDNFYDNMMSADRELGLGAQVADVERIRRILGDEKIILFGHSFGGLIASLYAAEFPGRVKALILVAPADLLVMPSEDGGLYEQVRVLLPANQQERYGNYIQRLLNFGDLMKKSDHDLAVLNLEFVEYYAMAAKVKGFIVPMDISLDAVGGWMMTSVFLSMGKKHDYRMSMKTVQAPTLVIHGEIDLQTETASRNFAGCFPNSKFTVIQHSGHFPFAEQPNEFAKVVGEFLGSLK